MPNIDDLQIQIEAESQQANKALDTLISKLGDLQKSLGASLKADGFKNVTSGMKSVQASSDNMAKSIKASMSDVNKTINDASKAMSKNLQEAFNIPSRNMKGVKAAVSDMTSSLAANGRDRSYVENVDNIAKELLKVASSGIKAENSMQGFYDTLKATSKIYINPVDLPADWSKGLDGLLRQKITTDSSSGATPLDTYIQEWKDEFPEIFNGFNTDSVYDQFETLKGALAQFRSEASEPIQMPGLSDAVYESVVEGTNEIIHKFEDMSEASRDTAKAISEHVQEIADKYAGLGEGFKFTGSTDGLEKKIESVTNALETANLKKQELEMSGDINSKMYENAVKDVTKYSNMLESLKQQQAEIASGTGTSGDDNWWDKVIIHGTEEAKKSLADFEEQLREADTILENGGVESDTGLYFPTRDLEISLEQLQNMRPQFENEIDAYEDMIERFQMEIELSKEAQGSLGEIGTHGAEIPSNLLDTSGLTASVKETQAAISELSDSTMTLRERLANMFGISSMHVYTEEYQNLQAEIDKTKAKIEKLNKAMTDHTADNPRYANTATYKSWQRQVEELTQKTKELEAEQANLESDGGAKTWNFSPISAMLDDVIAKTQSWKASIDSLYGKLSNVAGVVGKVTSAFAQLAFNPFGTVTKGIKNLTSKLKSLVPGLNSAKKATDGFNISNVGLVKSLTKTTKMLVLMIKRMALRGIISGAQEGFENLAQYCDECNASISLLMNSLNQLKNSFAAMVSPLLNAFAPALNYVIQLIIKAVNYINQLFAALTGKSTWIKATELSEDYTAGLSDAADAAEDLKTTTLGIDELNINGGDDDTGSGSGSSAGTSAADMFTTEDVESNIMELAEKIKGVVDDLFSTIKSAWDTTGAFVMESWETALQSVWSLIKSVGSDFLEVWTQAETVTIFEDLFTIIGDIGLVIANLATNFETAWNTADTGLHILENIRDLAGEIVNNFRQAADYTVQWAASVDFTNLLTSIENFTAAAKPAVDAISGALTDFYTDVLLPLASWSIQTGLPELIDVFTKFANEVDWEGLRANLKDLWSKLEPFAETVGEGVILFLERFLKLVKEIINSEKFQKILDWFGDWLDSVDAEDVANGIQTLATTLIALKAASMGLSALTSIVTLITQIGTAFTGLHSIISTLGKFFTSTFGSFTLLLTGVTLAVTSFVDMWNNGISGIKLALEALGITLAAIAAVILGWPTLAVAVVASVVLAVSTLVLYIKEHFEEIKTTVSNALQTVKNTVSNAWETIKTWTSETWEAIKTWILEAWENIKTAISEAIENVKEKVSEVWENIKSRTSEVWENIKSTLANVWGNITSSVTEKFEAIKEKITEIWDKVKNSTEDTWENIKTTIKNAINGIIGSINGLISGAVSGLNSVIELLNSISFDIPDWVPEWGGKTFGLNIQTISAPQIPYLEQGGFPTSASLFWAGENGVAELLGTVGGKTAVASGEEITGIRDSVESTGATEAQLLQDVISVLQTIANKDTSFVVDGRELVSTIDKRKSRNGYSFT